jgi:hypothetical protein
MMFNSPEILPVQNENKDSLTKESRGGKDDQFNNNQTIGRDCVVCPKTDTIVQLPEW